jgi:hypothetical protein
LGDFDGLDGHAGGDGAQKGERHEPRARRLHGLDGARTVPRLPQQALLHQMLDVLVDRGHRRQMEVGPDLLEAWRVALLGHEVSNEIIDLALSACERHTRPPSQSVRPQDDEMKAKVNPEMKAFTCLCRCLSQ